MAAPTDVVSLAEKFRDVKGLWSPHIVAEFNGFHVKLARVEGDFLWHTHEDTDEVFLIHRGAVTIEMRDREPVSLQEGDMFVVPAGVEHRPVADEQCELLLIEPAGTPNTGDESSAAEEPWI